MFSKHQIYLEISISQNGMDRDPRVWYQRWAWALTSPDTTRKRFICREDPLAGEAFLVSLQCFQGDRGEVQPQFHKNVGDETTGSPAVTSGSLKIYFVSLH